jgi:hypothetical protein
VLDADTGLRDDAANALARLRAFFAGAWRDAIGYSSDDAFGAGKRRRIKLNR